MSVYCSFVCFKQKTAYEMRISDWSSDVCSSDLVGLNKREAKEFVDAFFDALREGLQAGRQVKLSGFGNFDLRRKNQRPGRNPKTGEEIPISARTVATFRPGQKLKERVEAYSGGAHA